MDNIHGNIEEYSANEKRKISIVLMICLLIGKVNPDMLTNRKS